jgi:hypothetical protein
MHIWILQADMGTVARLKAHIQMCGSAVSRQSRCLRAITELRRRQVYRREILRRQSAVRKLSLLAMYSLSMADQSPATLSPMWKGLNERWLTCERGMLVSEDQVLKDERYKPVRL